MMRLALLSAGTALLLCQTAAMAQTNTPQANPQAATPSANSTAGAAGSMSARMRDGLQKAGFSDIRVEPRDFVIHAKDQDGNPVVMRVSPDSITAITEQGSSGRQDQARSQNSASNRNSASTQGLATSGSSEFVSVPTNDELSSNLVGLDIYNDSNQDIGKIKDVAMDAKGRAQAYIVSVGGFLGMGEHYVAVNPSDIKVMYNDNDKKWHATMNATADQLKAAPEFKYEGPWSASRT